ncbi:MAG: hypothetical protein ACRDBY_01255 [Cetobacterium sp.]
MEFILKNHHKYNFTTIYNNFAQDKTLSLEAKGLALYLFSMPSNWCINPTQLRFELQIGKDKVTKLINELIEKGYMFKYQKDIVFSKRGELRNIYYFSDDKEILKETTEIFRSSNVQPQLPMSETPYTEISYAEDPRYLNKDTIQEENNKKETILTSNISIRTFLKGILDEVTIVNLLSAKPSLTIEEFKKLYEMANLEFKNGYCNSVNACLVRAVSGKWNFKYKPPTSTDFSEEELKTHRVLKGKLNYYIDYFQIGSCSKNEILGKFLSECQKYDKNLVNSYFKKLKEKLES